MEDKLVQIFVRPLAAVIKNGVGTPKTADEFISFLTPIAENAIENARTRFEECESVEGDGLFAVPVIGDFFQQVIWPLRSAKGSFAVGNFIASISLCGTIAEVLATAIFKYSDAYLDEGDLKTGPVQAQLFGGPFDKLTQFRKIRILRVLKIIDKSAFDDFEGIRKIRNDMIHLKADALASAESAALTAYEHCMRLVTRFVGIGFSEDKTRVIFGRFMSKYIKDEGVVVSSSEASAFVADHTKPT